MMDIFVVNESVINSVALIVLSTGLALVSTLYVQSRNSRLRLSKENDEWKIKVDAALITLGTQMSPLWAQVQTRIASELHHPHPRYHEMDVLLEKLESKPTLITNNERSRLRELLSQRAVDTHPDITPQQKSSAALMLGVMDKVLEEVAIASDAPIPVPGPPPFPQVNK
jgi:hypothetical protein